MDETVKPKPKRSPQVRLENLDAQTVRALSKITGISIPHLLRQAIALLEAKHSKKADPGKDRDAAVL